MTNAPFSYIYNILYKNSITYNINLQYGSISFVYEGIKYDISIIRKDNVLSNNTVKAQITKSLYNDAIRRDFTINAIYLNIKTYQIYDFFNGYNDLRNGIINFIGNPIKRCVEDNIRILRYIRFYSMYSKQSHNPLVLYCIKKLSHTLTDFNHSRLFKECNKIIKLDSSSSVISNLVNQGHLNSIMFNSTNISLWQKVVLLHNKTKLYNIQSHLIYYILWRDDINIYIPTSQKLLKNIKNIKNIMHYIYLSEDSNIHNKLNQYNKELVYNALLLTLALDHNFMNSKYIYQYIKD